MRWNCGRIRLQCIPKVRMQPEIARVELCVIRPGKRSVGDLGREPCAVEEQYRSFVCTLGMERPFPDLQTWTLFIDEDCRLSIWILIHRDHLPIERNCQGTLRNVCEVRAQDQGRSQHRPHAKYTLLLLGR